MITYGEPNKTMSSLSSLQTVRQFIESVEGMDTFILFEAVGKLEDFVNKQTKKPKILIIPLKSLLY